MSFFLIGDYVDTLTCFQCVEVWNRLDALLENLSDYANWLSVDFVIISDLSVLFPKEGIRVPIVLQNLMLLMHPMEQ